MSRIIIEGMTIGQAEKRRYTDGTCVVKVRLGMGAGNDIVIERAFGTSPSADLAASSAARSLRPGTWVRAYGEGLKSTRIDGQQMLKLEGCSDLVHEAINHTETAAQAA